MYGIVHMDVRNKYAAEVFLTSVSFILGFLFYLVYRPQVLPFDLSLFEPLADASLSLPAWLFTSFPSFIFMPLIGGFSIALLTLQGFQGSKVTVSCLAVWLGIVVLFEGLQASELPYVSRGVFDWLDIVAAILGAGLTLLLLSDKGINSPSSKTARPWVFVPTLVLGATAILGSYNGPCDGDDKSDLCVSQVIMPWQEIRAEVQPDLSGNEVLTRTGKIYTLDDWLFVVEKYRGIHIFDVTDTLNPIRQLYLPIPGALDLTIKDGILYSSAFSDLITIDLNLLQQSEGLDLSLSRQEDVFEYPDTRQFYPDLYHSDYSEASPRSEGVVIGYRTKSGKVILYGDEYDLQTEEQRAEKENKDEDDADNVACVLLSPWLCRI